MSVKNWLMIIIVTSLIIFLNATEAYAICGPCSRRNHQQCTSTNIVDTGSLHTVKCCDGAHSFYNGAHRYGGSSSTAATCTQPGSSTRRCLDCGHTSTSSTPALGHNPGSWQSDKNQHWKTCTRCGAIVYSREDHYDNDLNGYCDACNYAMDITPPVITFTSDKVAKGNNLQGTITDNVGVTAYYINRTGNKPTATAGGWTSVSSTKTYNINLRQNGDLGFYYMWAKDARNNISSRASFEVGLAPVIENNNGSNPIDQEILENKNVSFSVLVSDGTTPLSYQWYKANNATGAGTALSNGGGVSGATTPTLNLTNVARSNNNTYYYCKVSNRFASTDSRHARLIVLYPPTLKALPGTESNPILIKKNGTYTFTAEVTTNGDGNTNYYTYQWYKAGSPTGAKALISGATRASYTVIPTADEVAYYFCEVKNYWNDRRTVAYTTTTTRGKTISDVTEPTIEMGEIKVSPTPNTRKDNRYINNTFTVTVPLTVKDADTGYTYVEDDNNLTANEIQVLVNNVDQSCTKTITYTKKSNYEVNYTLVITTIPSNGDLKIKMPRNIFLDKIGNGNVEKTFSTDIIVDNTKPVLVQDSYIDGANGRFINKDKELTMRLKLSDNYGFDNEEFTVDDIVVKVGSNNANGDLDKSLTKLSGTDKEYIYEFKISNIEGNGALSINIAANLIKDWATNGIAATSVPLTLANGTQIIIDNTPPVLTGIVAELSNYNSGTIYPNALYTWHGENGTARQWAKEDIYITLNATEENQMSPTDTTPAIDYYTTSTESGTNLVKMTGNKEVLTKEHNGLMYYRVYDMAGNYDEKNIEIKIDKTKPQAAKLDYYELRVDGVKYNYSESTPANRNLIINPVAWVDLGNVKSEVITNNITEGGTGRAPAVEKATATSDSKVYPSYYKVTMYTDKSKSSLVNSWTYNIKETSRLFEDDGFYVIQTVTTDHAGNVTISPEEYMYIMKSTNNTLRVSNIRDIGSGVNRLIINVYKADDAGNSTGVKAINEIVVQDPGTTYETTLRLGKGKFYVEVKIEDKTKKPDGSSNANVTVLHKSITNRI